MHLVGRILFATVFIASGVGHLTKTAGMVGYAQSKGAPAPKIVVPLTGVVIIVSGVLVVLGWHRFIAAGLLFLFLVPTAFVMHAFWKETDPMARGNEMAHFQKDLALAGAALLLAYYAGGVGDCWTWPMSLGG
ncbi:MAG: DoxX family protein [Gemmatimonadetes bacterium]|nr:DoxX family protein [Gemmatimonadota bacterium]